jgi:hypothetical protein
MYAASEFSGPISITSITFYNTEDVPGNIQEGTYTFRLSTSPLTVATMDFTDFAANVGADEALFAVADLSGSAFPSFSILGGPFVYDPADGDLLLDITVTYGVESPAVFLDSRSGTAGGAFSRYHNYGAAFADWGLVTGFNEAGGAIPEPSTLLLIPTAMVGLAFLRRRAAL